MKFDEQTKALKSLGVVKPTVLIDRQKAIRNIEQMLAKTKTSNTLFRPHFKTHQSAEIGDWFKQRGIKSITVTSVEMAKYFADNGWIDITIAIPVNRLEIIDVQKLNQKVNLTLLVDSLETVEYLESTFTSPVSILIKIDVGYGRAGIMYQNKEMVLKLTKRISNSSMLFFSGLLTHAGQTYRARSTTEIKRIFQDTIERLTLLKRYLADNGYGQCLLSVGDTPGCSLADDFSKADEARPGNFVFYDLTQEQLGVCSPDQIAVTVACPVVGKYDDRQEIIIYGGGVHFSKERILADGAPVFGYMTFFESGQWRGINKQARLTSLSQEHGKLKAPDDLFQQIQIGHILLFYPIHSCLTVDLHRSYLTLDQKVISKM